MTTIMNVLPTRVRGAFARTSPTGTLAAESTATIITPVRLIRVRPAAAQIPQLIVTTGMDVPTITAPADRAITSTVTIMIPVPPTHVPMTLARMMLSTVTTPIAVPTTIVLVERASMTP